ncbi:hypothetical protein ABVN80_14430 [Acinetobacter baumannii]
MRITPKLARVGLEDITGSYPGGFKKWFIFLRMRAQPKEHLSKVIDEKNQKATPHTRLKNANWQTRYLENLETLRTRNCGEKTTYDRI